jgi:hypothetical protein
MTERARSKTIQEEPPEHPTDMRDGTWSRLELLQMNARFVAAMEARWTQKRRHSAEADLGAEDRAA